MLDAVHRVVDSVRSDRISGRLLWLLVVVPVALVYISCGHWAIENTDSEAAAWPAWTLVHRGTLHLENVGPAPFLGWFIHGAHGHLVSSRMPGVALISVPIQAALAWTGWDALGPAVITAAILTAGAVANSTLLLRRLSNASAAVTGAIVLAFGTTLWAVAGTELFTHGPDVFWLSAGLLALAQQRTLLSGILFAPAVMTRPHLAVVIAAVGVVAAWSRRRPRILPQFAVPAALALALVVLYNWYLFGTASLSAGTYSYAGHSAVVGHGGGVLRSVYDNLTMSVGMLFSPMRGLVPYTPVVLVVLLRGRSAWRTLPDWARGATIGGVLYLLLQARINGIYSSSGFYGYRLTIEPMLLWAPIVFVAARSLWMQGRRALVYLLSAASVVIEVPGAVFTSSVFVSEHARVWSTWMPVEMMRVGGSKVVLMTGLATLLAVVVGVRVLAPQQGRRSSSRSIAPPSPAAGCSSSPTPVVSGS
jgi:hypothetical protein